MKKKKFFGYWIVVYTFVLMFFIFTIVKSLHGLFQVPVTESLHMERSEFSLLFTISGFSVALALPIVTKLLKRYSVRKILIGSILMVCLGFASFSLARVGWHFYLIALIVGSGTAGCTNMVISLLINNWFIARRGLALGIAFTGSGFGAVVLAPVMTYCLNTYGWQASYVFFGMLMLVICIPMTLLFAYGHPSDKGQLPYQDIEVVTDEVVVEENTGMYLHEIKTKPYFILYLLLVLLCSATLGGVHIHIPAYLTDIGHSSAFVATVIMVQSTCIIIGKILLGVIFDAKGAKTGTMFLGVMLTAAFTCLILAKNPVIAILFAVCYGCGATLTTVGIPYLTGSIFGQKDYTAILSVSNIAYVIGASVAPFITGLVYDHTGHYQICWMVYMALFVISIVSLILLESYLQKKIET